MAIIDYTTFKTLNGITSTSEDAKLTLLCGYADRWVKGYLGIDIESTSYPGAATNGKGDSGFYSGNGSRYLVLRQWPVTAVTSVYLDGGGYWGQGATAFAAATLLTEGTDYAWVKDAYISAGVARCGIIEKVNGTWPRPSWYKPGSIMMDPQTAQGNIKVAYTAGWTSVPGDIVQAAAYMVAFWRRTQDKGGSVTSESLGSYSYSMGPTKKPGIPDEVVALLAPYKEPRFA